MRRAGVTLLSMTVLAGLAGLTLIPASADAPGSDQGAISAAVVTSPSPDLIKALDRAVASPPVPTPALATSDTPDAPPGAETAVAEATPAVAVTPSIPPAALVPDAYVGSSAVHLRAGPSSSSDILSVLQPGEPLKVSDSQGGWVQVNLSDGTSGWIYSSLLTDSAEPATPDRVATAPTRDTAPAPKPSAVVHSDGGQLVQRTALIANDLDGYSAPGGSSDYTLEAGQRVRIVDVRGNWLQVRTPTGLTMWIRASAGT